MMVDKSKQKLFATASHAVSALGLVRYGTTLSGVGRRQRMLFGVSTVLLALITASVSFAILVGLTPVTPNERNTFILMACNIFFILLLSATIAREIHRILQARRAGKAASRLHIRIVALFSIVAALPAIVVAIVASVTLDVGLDRWFEMRTRFIVDSSIRVARAYVNENARTLQDSTLSMVFLIDDAQAISRLDPRGFQQILTDQAKGRGFALAQIVTETGGVDWRAEIDGSEALPSVPLDAIVTAADGNPVLIPPGRRSLVGAIIKLKNFNDRYLYTIRTVDEQVLRTLQDMEANTSEYNSLENNRTATQVAFALLYLGLTLIVLLSAIWTGIAVADRLVRPIRQLINAADAVAGGDLDVQVPVRDSDGDVAALAGTFNQMVGDIRTQRDELVSANEQNDARRRFSEALLGGVNAGVIGVSPEGTITVANRAATAILRISEDAMRGKKLLDIMPELASIMAKSSSQSGETVRESLPIKRNTRQRVYNVQITSEYTAATAHASVVTFDDITDLIDAQRSSAWADVARRIAHEIKNPLTPIQLSAERLRRRYGDRLTDDREVFDRCTETIIRQVGDIGRMVDEFSTFARMPKPTLSKMDLRNALNEASFLVELSRDDLKFDREFGDVTLIGAFDSRLIGQAFGNVIKNASEAIDGRKPPIDQGEAEEQGHIRIRTYQNGGELFVDVADNGKGLPVEDRDKLLEPYITTREKGTGLGLAIVKKIVEDHQGRLELLDAPRDFHGGRGAMVRMVFPALSKGPLIRQSGDASPLTSVQ